MARSSERSGAAGAAPPGHCWLSAPVWPWGGQKAKHNRELRVGARALCSARTALALAAKHPGPGVPSPGSMVVGRCLLGVCLQMPVRAGGSLARHRGGQQQAGKQQDTEHPKPLHAVAVPCEMPGMAKGDSKAWESQELQRCLAVPAWLCPALSPGQDLVHHAAPGRAQLYFQLQKATLAAALPQQSPQHGYRCLLQLQGPSVPQQLLLGGLCALVMLQ